MKESVADSLRWLRLAALPSSYAHESWLPALPVPLAQLSDAARAVFERDAGLAMGLPPLSLADTRMPGARVGLISRQAHGALAEALLALSTGRRPREGAPEGSTRLAELLGARPLPWRTFRCACVEGAAVRALEEGQLTARLCAAAAAFGAGWAARWRLRHPKCASGSPAVADAAGWWVHVEACLVRLYGSEEGVPCL